MGKKILFICLLFCLAGSQALAATSSSSTTADPAFGIFGVIFMMFYLCIGLCFPILAVTISVIGIVLWIMMIIDVVQRQDDEFPNSKPNDNQKLIWILVVILASYIGALIYYFTIYKKIPRRK